MLVDALAIRNFWLTYKRGIGVRRIYIRRVWPNTNANLAHSQTILQLYGLPLLHNQTYFGNWYAFPALKLTKFLPPYGANFKFCYTIHVIKRSIPHVNRARPLNGFKEQFEFGWKYNRICFADNLRWKFCLFFSEPGSAKFVKDTIKWVYGMEFAWQ